MTALKLTLLRVESFKRVDEAQIALDPTASGVVALMGPNESGKTSTLDAFEALVAGRATPKRSKPVKSGAGKATIVGEFTEDDGTVLRVTRTYTDGGGTSIVVHQDGLKVTKSESILRRLYSHIALDPLAFANLPSKEQADTLIRLIGVDPAPFDAQYARAFDTRTEANRDVKRLTTELAAFPPEDAATAGRDLVDVGALTGKIAEIIKRNDERRTIDRAADDANAQAERLDEQIRRMTAERDHLRAAAAEYEANRDTLGDYESVDALQDQITTAEATNDRIRAQKRRAERAAELATAVDRVTNLEGLMAEAVDGKAAAFADAKWPVPGLDIVDGEVLLEGTPFAETSAGRKLRTSTAIAIALNPELRAIVIRDGSLLDDENRATIDEIARANGFTVLMEIVGRDAETGVVFSEGSIVDRVGAVS